ncbi:MAG: elongation factor G-like protein EF-G2 [Thermoleophilia bacterium]|nr:elongation factor G-like protein EF-G2 [Thermoleophilia bacterium]
MSTHIPSPSRPDEIRNVVLVGPGESGKSTLFDHLVAARTPGHRAKDDHARSVGVNLVAFRSGPVAVNLLDTPGHPDFVGDVRAGLRAADAAVFVVSAADGIDEATRMLWRECDVLGIPRAIAVSKLETQRSDFAATVATCQRAFGDAQPLCFPLVDAERVAGVIDLLSRVIHTGSGKGTDREPTAEEAELIDEYRGALIESIIEESEDEAMLERYLSGEEIDESTLEDDLRAAVTTGSFFPIVPVHAIGDIGVEQILSLIEHGFPSPAQVALPVVTTPDGGGFGEITCDPHGPLVAEVIRTSTDQYIGRLSLVRVFSGTLAPDQPVHVSGHLEHFVGHTLEGHPGHDSDDDRVGTVSTPVGHETHPKERVIAGDMALVTKLAHAETSDTLSTKEMPALVEPWVLPEPLLPVAIHAKSSNDEEKLSTALHRLVAEDVTMRMEHNPDTHQLVLWAMGPSHVDELIARLKDRFHVEVEVEPLRTALRETFVKACTAKGRLVKQSGGHGQYAVCDIEIEPLERGAGIEFVDKVVGGAVPRKFIPSVEKGVRAQLDRGLLAGYPVVDVRVTLVDGKAHSVDSSDMAFQTAGAQALREAVTDATVALLEPIDAVDITVGDEMVGAVLADLRGRRGQVVGTEPAEMEAHTVVHAEVPQHELSRYPIDLRAVSHGTGTFTRTLVRYDYMPPNLARELTEPG